MTDIELAKELRDTGASFVIGLDASYDDYVRELWLAVARRAKAIHAERDKRISELAERIKKECALTATTFGHIWAGQILALLRIPKEPTQ